MKNISCDELSLTTRARNCLRNEGIHDLKGIVAALRDPFFVTRAPNMGRKTLNELRELIHDNGGNVATLPPQEGPSVLRRLQEPKEAGFSVYLRRSEFAELLGLSLSPHLRAKIERAQARLSPP